MSVRTWIPKNLLLHEIGDLPEVVTGVTSDSRKVTRGTAFVAVAGNTADGHGFISQAIEKGATVIVHERPVEPIAGVAFLQVRSSRKALALMSLAFQGNPQKALTFAGVTGTNGKTTITTIVWQMLRDAGITAGLLGTVRKVYGKTEVQSALTTAGPEELAADLRRMVDEGATHCIMEVSSHALDQDRVFGIRYHVAGFTNLTHDHLDYHKTFEAYAAAKKQLFDGLDADAIAVINIDDPKGEFMVGDSAAQVWRVGFGKPSEGRLLKNSVDGILVDLDGQIISSPLVGRFNAYNVAQAYHIGVALGLSPKIALSALERSPGAPGRLQKIHSNGDPVSVFVDYAHTPDALQNILETLQEVKTPGARIITVFGCGGNRDATKRPVMAGVAERLSDEVIVTSDNPRFEEPAAIINDILKGFSPAAKPVIIEDREAAIAQAIGFAPEGAVIVIAGKGHENYQDIKGVKHPMDDARLALQALHKRKTSR